MNAERIAEVMEKAAQIIQKRGHCQGQARDMNGRVCTAGAMAMAMGYQPEEAFNMNGGVAIQSALDAFCKVNATGSFGICMWNNEAGRTAGEVIAALNACAALQRAAMEEETACT